MSPSIAIRAFVGAYEGLRTVADNDDGTWTIGFGHTRGVKAGDTCTLAQANDWLTDDLEVAAAAVRHAVKVPLLQNQFDALVSFTFNLGAGALSASGLLGKVNAAQNDAVIAQLLRWNKSQGHVLRGLLARRAGEGLIYAFADYTGR